MLRSAKGPQPKLEVDDLDLFVVRETYPDAMILPWQGLRDVLLVGLQLDGFLPETQDVEVRYLDQAGREALMDPI
jgi:hypothetical protein